MTQQEFQQRYTIVERLGEGGFGEVFKVYDTVRDRWVAMKVSKVKLELENVRLRNEVEMVNQLPEHPNIAFYEACYTFHERLGEYDYGILQYYEEGNLLQLLNKTLTDAQTLSGLIQKTAILTQILNGLGFLHENGIIHRDLKPQNILMVRSLNGEYVPKITDFGISKKFDVNQSSFYSNSLGGAGTLAYSSPEQLAGHKISKNADLWSFGVITFRVLTGQLPFDTGGHASTSEAGRQELFRQINSGHLPDSVNQIPEPWQTLIRRCLITDPVQRIKNVQMAKAVLADTHGRDGARPVSTKTADDPTRIDRPPSPKPLTPPNPVRINTEPPPPPPPVLKYMLIAACTTVIVCLTVFAWQQLHHSSKGNNNTELAVVPSDTVSIIQDSTVQEPPPTERTSGAATTAQTQPARTPVQEPPKQSNEPLNIPASPKSETWIEEYDILVNRAQLEFKNRQYDKAKNNYNLALRLIPLTDMSNKRIVINGKISECDQMIKEQEEAAALEKEKQEWLIKIRKTEELIRREWSVKNRIPESQYESECFFYFVFFNKNIESVASDDQLLKVAKAAEVLNNNPNTSLKIVAYLPKGYINGRELGEKRSRSIAKIVTDIFNIAGNRISIDWRGDEIRPFSDEYVNDVVTLEILDKNGNRIGIY